MGFCMTVDIFTEPIEQPLVETLGVISEEALKELATREKSVLKDILGARNEMWLGRPRVYDITHYASELDTAPLSELKGDRIYFVHCMCSFRPASKCEFVRASLRIFLEGMWAHEVPAVALDLFPRDIYVPVTYRRTFKVAPSLTIGAQKLIEAKLSLIEGEISREYVAYEPEIVAFGSYESEFGWDFNRTKARTLRGMRDLFFIAQGSDSSEVRFQFTATIQTRLGPLPLPEFVNPSNGSSMLYERFRLAEWVV